MKWAGKERICFDVTDSTNVRAAVAAAEGAAHGTLVTAQAQTAGRGRRGRSWSSPAGVNLYFSLLLRPEFAPEKAPMLTLVMALAVLRAVRKECGDLCGIKWPNDLVIGGRKVCGILTELRLQQMQIEHVIVGVGINVKEQIFPEETADKATCLERETGKKIEKEILLESILEAFEECYEKFLETEDLSGLKEEYENCLLNKDAGVRVLDPQGEYEGIARGITPGGELLVETTGGQLREVYAGEVSVRGIYGYV